MPTVTVLRTIVAARRLPSSALGNPRWELVDQNGSTYRTRANAAIGYEIDNFRRLMPGRFALTLAIPSRPGARSYVIGLVPATAPETAY
jgi:hypothetical protein